MSDLMRTGSLEAAREAGAGSVSAPSLRVLVVDDDLSVQSLLSNYFEQHNLLAVPAQGRQDVIRQFAAEEPDAVILDLQLGCEDGLDLLREIRFRSDVPILIVTGQ